MRHPDGRGPPRRGRRGPRGGGRRRHPRAAVLAGGPPARRRRVGGRGRPRARRGLDRRRPVPGRLPGHGQRAARRPGGGHALGGGRDAAAAAHRRAGRRVRPVPRPRRRPHLGRHRLRAGRLPARGPHPARQCGGEHPGPAPRGRSAPRRGPGAVRPAAGARPGRGGPDRPDHGVGAGQPRPGPLRRRTGRARPDERAQLHPPLHRGGRHHPGAVDHEPAAGGGPAAPGDDDLVHRADGTRLRLRQCRHLPPELRRGVRDDPDVLPAALPRLGRHPRTGSR